MSNNNILNSELINACFHKDTNLIDNIIEIELSKDEYFIKSFDYDKLYLLFKNKYNILNIKEPNIYYNNFIYMSNRLLSIYNNYLRYNTLYKCF